MPGYTQIKLCSESLNQIFTIKQIIPSESVINCRSIAQIFNLHTLQKLKLYYKLCNIKGKQHVFVTSHYRSRFG